MQPLHTRSHATRAQVCGGAAHLLQAAARAGLRLPPRRRVGGAKVQRHVVQQHVGRDGSQRRKVAQLLNTSTHAFAARLALKFKRKKVFN